jgi:hypothetical protein
MPIFSNILKRGFIGIAWLRAKPEQAQEPSRTG